MASKVQVGRLTYTSTFLFLVHYTIFLICLVGTRVAETLSQEILSKMYAPEKPPYPIITPDIICTYDAFILGVPTRYGNMPAQWKVRSR